MVQVYNRVNILGQLVFSYFVNIFVFIVAPFGTIVLSRGLSISDFGVYSIFFGWLNIGLQLFPLGFQLFIQNFLPGRSLSEQKQVMSALVKFIFVVLCVLFIFWLAFGDALLNVLNIRGRFFESLLTLCAVIISVFAFLTTSWLVARKELEFSSFLYGVNSTTWILLSFAEFFLTGKIVLSHIILFWIIGAILQLLLSLFKLGSASFGLVFPIKFVGAFGIIKQALVFGLPLIPLIISSWFLTIFDRSLLNVYSGSAVLGLYALAYALVNIISSFGSLVANIFYPYVASAHNLGHKKEYSEFLNASLKYTLLIVLPGLAGIYSLRSEIITMFAGAKFLEGQAFVKYLILFPLFSSIVLVLQTAVIVNKKSFSVSLVYIFSFLINYFLNRFLIPIYGGIGASLSVVITYFVLAAGMFFLSRGLFNFEWNFIKLGRIFVCSSIMGLVLISLHPESILFKLASILLGVFVYALLVLLFGVFGKEELVIAKNLFFNKFGNFF